MLGRDVPPCATGCQRYVKMRVVGLVHVHLRHVETVDDIADVTAPAPIEPGVATAEDVYTVEVVLASTDGPVVPVLARPATE